MDESTGDYRPVSRLAVAALAAGAVSALALTSQFAWVLPLVAIGIAVAALADVNRAGGGKAGGLAAVAGLALAVGFGAGRDQHRGRPLARRAPCGGDGPALDRRGPRRPAGRCDRRLRPAGRAGSARASGRARRVPGRGGGARLRRTAGRAGGAGLCHRRPPRDGRRPRRRAGGGLDGLPRSTPAAARRRRCGWRSPRTASRIPSAGS